MKELVEQLKIREVVVKFVKADKSLRTMRCTLQEEYLPETKGNSRKCPDLVTVFDTEKKAWRSFKPSRVQEWY